MLIFNRYGKLITKIDPLGMGWDGTLNGEPLPTDDYWFFITLQDGRIFKSHFTLKR
ncbi:T9SS type B sorting domain-containing protein [Mangrovimonas futianensis]|uniref:T9SS type B sorting domain-containing protein n=1 Tax=Mangrovimonas futianensis TaxID=2895523 RepID=UPI00300D45CF